MPAFRFHARDGKGQMQTGILDAKDAQDARLRVEGRGLTPVRIEAAVLKQKQAYDKVGGLGLPASRKSKLVLLILVLILGLAVYAWLDPHGLVEKWLPAVK